MAAETQDIRLLRAISRGILSFANYLFAAATILEGRLDAGGETSARRVSMMRGQWGAEGVAGEGRGGGGDVQMVLVTVSKVSLSPLISLPPSVIIALAAKDSPPPDTKTNRLNLGWAETPSPNEGSTEFEQLSEIPRIERLKLSPS